MNFDFEDDETEEIDDISLDEISNQLPTFTSDKLVEIVVSNRYLGISDNLAILAMTELSNRRSLGENFDFEDKIESQLKRLPRLDFKMPDLREVVMQAVGKIK